MLIGVFIAAALGTFIAGKIHRTMGSHPFNRYQATRAKMRTGAKQRAITPNKPANQSTYKTTILAGEPSGPVGPQFPITGLSGEFNQLGSTGFVFPGFTKGITVPQERYPVGGFGNRPGGGSSKASSTANPSTTVGS